MQHAKFVFESFLQLDVHYLKQLCCDITGSRVIESFMSSSSVTLQQKQEIIDKLKGSFVTLARNFFAAHCVEKFYEVAEISRKEMIASEVGPHEKELLQDNNGKFVVLNCNIIQYNQKKDVWKQGAMNDQKKRQMFQEILEDETPAFLQPKKKQKKSHHEEVEETPVEPTEEVNGEVQAEAPIDEDEIDDIFSQKPVHINPNLTSKALASNSTVTVKSKKKKKNIAKEDLANDAVMKTVLQALSSNK